MISHWSVSNIKSFQDITNLIIRADLNNVVVWMVSPCPLITQSFSSFTNNWRIVLNQTSCSIAFSSLGRSRYNLSLRFLLILLSSLPGQWSQLFGRFSFLLNITRSGNLADIMWSVCNSKSQRTFCVLMSSCAHTICWYGQISISLNIPSGSHYLPRRA